MVYDKDLYNILNEIQHSVWRIKNKSITLAYDWQNFSFGYKERFGSFPKDKDVIGKTLPADIAAQTKYLGRNISSSTQDAASQEAVAEFNKNKINIINGRESIITYKRNGSFPIKKTQIKNITKMNSSKYSANLSLLSREGAKERGMKGQIPVTLATGKGANLIIDKVISGEYRLCDSRISKRKNKFYLLLTYDFEQDKSIYLDENKVMGVDVGVINAAVMAFNDSKERYFIGGSEISAFRRKVERVRNDLLKQRKYCGKGSRGHGTKTRLKPTEKLSGKIANFRDTTNHKYSRYIVDMAIKHNCGAIQIERLDGINERNTFLKYWPYFDLQTKIKNKAEEFGIEVREIDSYFTSQRCSECGHVDKDNRKVQSEFKCTRCNYTANADYNAAKNISLPDIEELIKHELNKVSVSEIK